MRVGMDPAGSVNDWITLLAERVRLGGAVDGAQDNYSALALWVGDPQLITLSPMPMTATLQGK